MIPPFGIGKSVDGGSLDALWPVDTIFANSRTDGAIQNG
jgi:hypothetical protein